MTNESLNSNLQMSNRSRIWIARVLVLIGWIVVLCSLPMVTDIGFQGGPLKLWQNIVLTSLLVLPILLLIWMGEFLLMLMATLAALFNGRLIVLSARVLSVPLTVSTIWAIMASCNPKSPPSPPYYVMALGIVIIAAAIWVIPVKTRKISN
ncbi:MAG TPA: hypothetical protein VMG59_09285 [Phycisphaerae bacterium]|nr:hypothetical protein [Phycisphaerae bacterium]